MKTSSPLVISHTLTVQSQEPVTTREPSDEKVIDVTRSVCPLNMVMTLPVVATPDADRLIRGPRSEIQAIRRSGNSCDVTCVTFERTQNNFAGFRLPKNNRFVLRAGEDARGIRRKYN